MCGQLHHTTPGSGVLSHQWSQEPPHGALGLPVEDREGLGLGGGEALGLLGVDIAEAKTPS